MYQQKETVLTCKINSEKIRKEIQKYEINFTVYLDKNFRSNSKISLRKEFSHLFSLPKISNHGICAVANNNKTICPKRI